jgi:hypothetical protein
MWEPCQVSQDQQLHCKREDVHLCKSKGHASWSRTCPAFMKRLAEFNARNPDNSLQFFPTSDAWTWTMVKKPATAGVHAAPALNSNPGLTKQDSIR